MGVITTLLFTAIANGNAQGSNEPGIKVAISGIVKDDTGPLPGVSVIVSGATGVSTSSNGKFSLNVEIGKTITFSMIGYETKKLKITKADANLVIILKTDEKVLNDVVVIGYQQVSKRSVTAAITSLDPKTIEDIPAPTFDALLQGRVAG